MTTHRLVAWSKLGGVFTRRFATRRVVANVSPSGGGGATRDYGVVAAWSCDEAIFLPTTLTADCATGGLTPPKTNQQSLGPNHIHLVRQTTTSEQREKEEPTTTRTTAWSEARRFG